VANSLEALDGKGRLSGRVRQRLVLPHRRTWFKVSFFGR
jgi:hypothetical protein